MSDASEHSLCVYLSVSVSACILLSATVSSCHGRVRKCVDKWTSVNEALLLYRIPWSSTGSGSVKAVQKEPGRLWRKGFVNARVTKAVMRSFSSYSK